MSTVITGRYLHEFWDSVYSHFVNNGGGRKKWDLSATKDSRGLVFTKHSLEYQHSADLLPGQLVLTQSLRELKNIDKAAVLNDLQDSFFANIANGSTIYRPQLLFPNTLLCYVDAKNLKFHFWLCCLTVTIPRGVERTIGPVSTPLSREFAFAIYKAIFRYISRGSSNEKSIDQRALLLSPVLGLKRRCKEKVKGIPGNQILVEGDIYPLEDIWFERFKSDVYLLLFGGNEMGHAELPSYANNLLSFIWHTRDDVTRFAPVSEIDEYKEDGTICNKEVKLICVRGKLIDQFWDTAAVEADVSRQVKFAENLLGRISATSDLKDRSIMHSFQLKDLKETTENYQQCKAFISAHGGLKSPLGLSAQEQEHLLHFDDERHSGFVHALENFVIKDKNLHVVAEIRDKNIHLARAGLSSDQKLSRSWEAVIAAEEAYLDARAHLGAEVDKAIERPEKDNALYERSSALGWDYQADPSRYSSEQPTVISISSQKSPSALLKQASNLNLSLMTWREWPQLKLEAVRKKSCLLLGAGTLGCAVARCLLAWGFGSITLVDNGRVKYSNPTRQCLFELRDCYTGEPTTNSPSAPEHESSSISPDTCKSEISSTKRLNGETLGKQKAIAARDALHRIDPGAEVHGIELEIPSPGCAQGLSKDMQCAVFDEIESSICMLSDLIENNDIVFSLLDTREARWLPTMMTAAAVADGRKKLMITAAIGFDSYLVLRHNSEWDGCLGCYFCSDVTSGAGSEATPLADRPLDRQCSVTRPGISGIVGGLAVEMAVQLVQIEQSEERKDDVPHQIRGSLRDWSQKSYTVPRFDKCVACSPGVVQAYKSSLTSAANPRSDFIEEVLRDPQTLYSASGLDVLMREAEESMQDLAFE